MKYREPVRVGASVIIMIAARIWPPGNELLRLAVYLTAYVVVGIDVLIRAVRNLVRGNMLDENFLMSIATVGAFIVGDYTESVAVMLFYKVGAIFEDYAVDKSRRSISELMDIRPDYANLVRDGETVTVDPYDVAVGDIIVVKPGERVPLDSEIIEGNSSLDTSALTGESLPREVGTGDALLSGSININGVLKARVTREFGDSTASRILELVENATNKKSHSEGFITKFARVYTPAVVGMAAVMAIVPPLLVQGAEFTDWIYRALTFLVISCPCALVISVPLSFFGGIGGASKHGILVKGSNYLEALAYADTIVFDKTGTLTRGVFKVQEVSPEGISSAELLMLAAYAEHYSNHPISESLRSAFGEEIDPSRITEVREIPGYGVSAKVDGRAVLAGNAKLMRYNSIELQERELYGTAVHIAVDGVYAGCVLIADEMKSDSASAIAELRGENVKRTVMLTGDSRAVGERIARELGISEVYTELLPEDKVAHVEAMLERQSGKGKLAFVGDGINDAPVLARADIGIAMGGLGSDAAIEAADVVIMTDEPSKIALAMRISRRTLQIVRQNITFALGVKGLVLLLGAMGHASMWAAVFADVGVSVIAILNAMRCGQPAVQVAADAVRESQMARR